MIKSEYSFNLFTLHETELDAKRGAAYGLEFSFLI